MVIPIESLHTTPMGADRVRRNLSLDVANVVTWVQKAVRNSPAKSIVRRGKNRYVFRDDFVITINAHSNTIITAHRRDKFKVF